MTVSSDTTAPSSTTGSATSRRAGPLTIDLLYGISILGLAALMVHTVANAVVRTATGTPLTDTTEFVSGWYMPVAVLVGILITYIANEHTRAGLVYGQLGDGAKRVVLVIATVIQLVLVVAIAVTSIPEALHSFQIGEHYGISSVVIWPIKWLIPITFTLMSLVLVKRLFHNFRSDAVLRDAGETAETSTA